MNTKLNCIMLIDDDSDDNFFHETAIMENNFLGAIIVQDSGLKALDYIKSKTLPCSDLIFLDINMPRMSGWDFLNEYNLLNNGNEKKPIIIMLSTSYNNDDIAKANENVLVSEYITKPLTKEIFETIIVKYFK